MKFRAIRPPRRFAPMLARLVAPAVMVLALVACGSNDEEAAEPAATAVVPPAAVPPAAPATKAPATQPAASATPAPEVAQLPIPELLKAATLAVAEQRLIAPPANNAIEYYLAVLDQDENNLQAMQALVDLFPIAASIAERAVTDRRLEDGDRIVAMLDRASPGSYTVTTIKAKLDAARQTVTREEDRRVAAEQAAQAAATLAAQVAAAPPPPAAPVLPEPEPTPPPAPTQVAAAPPPPPQAPPATPPAASSETRDAQLVRAVQPTYPTDAVRKRLQGWVELEFTVGSDGRVTNVSVARAQPVRVFDREAVKAMQQWTFRPAVRNGTVIESRRRQRMEFTLGG